MEGSQSSIHILWALVEISVLADIVNLPLRKLDRGITRIGGQRCNNGLLLKVGKRLSEAPLVRTDFGKANASRRLLSIGIGRPKLHGPYGKGGQLIMFRKQIEKFLPSFQISDKSLR